MVPGRGLCAWCRLRIHPNALPHWSGSGISVLDGVPGSGIPVHSPFLHSGAPRDILIGLKFEGRRPLAREAAQLMAGSPGELPGRGDLIVPLPLGRRRARERGFNQSALIASALAGLTGARTANVLEREDRPPQVGLTGAERRRNMEGAFQVRRMPPDAGRIWLLDDVVTTGSSMDNAARALEEASVKPYAGITLTYRSAVSDGIIALYRRDTGGIPDEERPALRR